MDKQSKARIELWDVITNHDSDIEFNSISSIKENIHVLSSTDSAFV